jgi:hypothetical protein
MSSSVESEKKELFITSFDALIDAGIKILSSTMLHGKADPILGALKGYDKIWQETKEGPSKHIERVQEIALLIRRFVAGLDEEKDISDRLMSIFVHLSKPGAKSYKITPAKGKKTIYVTSIVQRGERLAEEYRDKDDAPEKIYLDIFVLNFLRSCHAVDEKSLLDPYISHLEENLGIERGAEIRTDSNIVSVIKGFARDVIGKPISDSDLNRSFDMISKNKAILGNFREVFDKCTKAHSPGEALQGIFDKMKDVQLPDKLKESMEAVAKNVQKIEKDEASKASKLVKPGEPGKQVVKAEEKKGERKESKREP